MVDKYRGRLAEPDFYTALFQDWKKKDSILCPESKWIQNGRYFGLLILYV